MVNDTLRTCGNPKTISGPVREIVAVLRRNLDRGMRIRTYDERWREILEWVRESYPDAQLNDLASGTSELAKFQAELELERFCDECHGSMPWNCRREHAAVLLRDNFHDGRKFDRPIIYVAYLGKVGRCESWKSWKTNQTKEKNPTAAAVAAFSL